MKRLLLILFLVCTTLFLSGFWLSDSSAQITEEPSSIENPLPGQAVQGLIQITGSVEPELYEFYEIHFSFSDQNTWFLITSGEVDPENQILGEWDTSAITDGNYDLRLSVFSSDTDPQIFISRGIRVRNYTEVETNTPVPTTDRPASTSTPIPQYTPTQPIIETITPLSFPENQAKYSSSDLGNALIRGGIFGIILFVFLALYFMRKNKK